MSEPGWMAKWCGQVSTPDDLVRFVDDVGFCTIGALERCPGFPSQAAAMGRDDVLGVTWFWKDDLHIAKHLYYTRLFGGKPGFISYEFLPLFIATNGETMDEMMMYGKVPAVGSDIYRVIDDQGPISTKKLKAQLGPDAGKAATAILIWLECKFVVTKTDLAGRTLNTYSYVWDLAERWTPDAFEEADRIGQASAADNILTRLSELGVDADHYMRTRILRWTGDLLG